MKETIRQKQIGETIRRHFSMVLMQEGSLIYGREPLVTVANVRMSPDLMIAKIYISVWHTDNKQAVLLLLEDELPRLRHALIGKIGRHLRRMPEIQLFLDDTVDEMYRVDELLNRLEAERKAS